MKAHQGDAEGVPWREQSSFESLCDIVASDRLVLVTGAGISVDLVREDGENVPAWTSLLKELAEDAILKAGLGAWRAEFDALLETETSGDSPSGIDCIEAASLLEDAEPEHFRKRVAELLTPSTSQPEEIRRSQDLLYDRLIGLRSRGIITFNVDRQHFAALQRRHEDHEWLAIDPQQHGGEAAMRDWLRGHDLRPFLLEAHGSVESTPVFSYNSYRALLEQRPAYGAFMQNLLTNFSFVAVGFGLSDLDFDQFVQTMAMQFGEPLHRHVKVDRHPKGAWERRLRARLHLRYGIEFLSVEDYDEIPEVLEAAATTPGPELRQDIERCLSSHAASRREGHRAMARLGPNGQRTAAKELLMLAQTDASSARRSEAVYSLAFVSSHLRSEQRQRTGDALLRILEKESDSELLAHALLALENYCSTEDLPRLQSIKQRLLQQIASRRLEVKDRLEHLPAFIDSLIFKLLEPRSAESRYIPD